MSGYTSCACPSCFEIAIAGDDDTEPLCHACEEAGCTPEDGDCCVEDDSCPGCAWWCR
jgi:hypothetical protein